MKHTFAFEHQIFHASGGLTEMFRLWRKVVMLKNARRKVWGSADNPGKIIDFLIRYNFRARTFRPLWNVLQNAYVVISCMYYLQKYKHNLLQQTHIKYQRSFTGTLIFPSLLKWSDGRQNYSVSKYAGVLKHNVSQSFHLIFLFSIAVCSISDR